jgi:hypothetical protein
MERERDREMGGGEKEKERERETADVAVVFNVPLTHSPMHAFCPL